MCFFRPYSPQLKQQIDDLFPTIPTTHHLEYIAYREQLQLSDDDIRLSQKRLHLKNSKKKFLRNIPFSKISGRTYGVED